MFALCDNEQWITVSFCSRRLNGYSDRFALSYNGRRVRRARFSLKEFPLSEPTAVRISCPFSTISFLAALDLSDETAAGLPVPNANVRFAVCRVYYTWKWNSFRHCTTHVRTSFSRTLIINARVISASRTGKVQLPTQRWFRVYIAENWACACEINDVQPRTTLN